VNTEQQIIEALTQLVSRSAAENLLWRALANSKKQPEQLSPQGWIELMEGPLTREISTILPISSLPPSLKQVVNGLAKIKTPSATPAPAPAALPQNLMPPEPLEWVDLSSTEERKQLVIDLAKLDGVTGVFLESRYGHEGRLGANSDNLPTILATVNRLLGMQNHYRIFYAIIGPNQLLLRALEGGWLAVLIRTEGNLGHMLYRMNRIAARPKT
jgi:hypothetical protein